MSWRCVRAFNACTTEAITAALHSAVVRLGAAPVAVVWQGFVDDPQAVTAELQRILTLPRLVSLDCSARRGLLNSHLQTLAAHAGAQKTLQRLRIGGFSNAHVTAQAVRALCEQLPGLTALSVDHLADEGHAVAVAAAVGGADHPAAAQADPPAAAADDDDPNPLSFLPSLPGLRSFEIRRWLAEELTAASLPCIVTQLPALTALYLENMESFDHGTIQLFFRSALMTRSIRHLSLSHVDLGAHNLRQAFQTEAEAGVAAAAVVAPGGNGMGAPINGAAAAYLAGSDASLWSSLSSLTSLSLIRCRHSFTLFPHLLTAPALRRVVIRGILDSWGVELPKREDLLRLMMGAPNIESLRLMVHTTKKADMDNLRAQLGCVRRVEFVDGSLEPENPGAF